MTAPAAVACGEVAREIPLADGWQMSTPAGLRVPARVPCTAASALRAQKLAASDTRFDEGTYSFHCRFACEPAAEAEEIRLQLGGIATLAEVRLNGERIVESRSMFASHEVDVTQLVRAENELEIVCLPLAEALRERKGRRPAARWRTRVVEEQQLRWFRTTLLGRAPGFAAGPAPVGPWRPITLLRRKQVALERFARRAELDGTTGVLSVDVGWRVLPGGAAPIRGRVFVGGSSAPLALEESRASGTVRISGVELWWPHTHGDPVLYPVRAELDLANGQTAVFDDVPAGFRSLGPDWRVNGAPVFTRGVVWTPPDVVSLAPSEEVLRERLERLRNGGCNLVRLAGTMTYESDAFHRLCDRLGILVWQDLMFANMDYPFEDAGFAEAARGEAECELTRLARHASTAVVCGNSEIEQQAAMLGLDPASGRGVFFGRELPDIAARCCPGVPYISSAPSGGDLPFRTHTGVSNYFGVGAYLRPLEDARRSAVRFASECLAFSNVPEPEAMTGSPPAHPSWKRGVPRDGGAGWDFEDVRDHYLRLLYGLDPLSLRYSDAARYWELSRLISGEVMAEVFGEWRRPGSSCAGGIVLWGSDLEAGAGWGILDSEGRPKCAYWFLKRALAAQSVWMTNEGLNGVDVHAANDGPDPLTAVLRVALYRNGADKVAEAESAIVIPARGALTIGVEQMLGRFVDAAYAYRFGPPGHDLVVASLHRELGDVPCAQSFLFPAGRSTQRAPIDHLGLSAEVRQLAGGEPEVLLRAARFAWGVRVTAPGFEPDDAYFGVEPGGAHRVVLKPTAGAPVACKAVVTAANAEGRWRL